MRRLHAMGQITWQRKTGAARCEQETVGNETSGNDVHQQSLEKGTVIVENLNLEKVTSGHYFPRGCADPKENTNTAARSARF